MKNLEIIKQAVELEAKHNYIDVRGKTRTFSRFILEEIDQNGWKNLYEVFKTYPTSDVSSRMKMIKQLVQHIKSETGKPPKNPEDTDVMYVKGVGPKVGALFHKLGIFTAYDLLHYYPRKHLDYANRTQIKDLIVGTEVTIFGKIIGVGHFESKKRSNLTIFTITISDNTGIIAINRFFGKTNKFVVERYRSQFPKDSNIIVSGVVKFDDYTGKLTIDSPEMEAVGGGLEEVDSLHLNRIVPVYPVTENLNVKTLRRAINNAIEIYSGLIEEFIPEHIRKKFNLIEKKQAIKQIHFPNSGAELEQARVRLVFEEFFLLQLKLALIRQKAKTDTQGLRLEIKKDGLVENFVKSLPFELTNAQKEAFDEIMADVQKPEPMRRLLQGDVGSGKTVVACMTLLAAVENGYQGAIMAPTEILAEQHFRNFTQWLTPLGLSVGLFVGKHGVKIRREMHQNLKSGQIHVAVGTHALIQEDVEFNKLGMVIIDEQHRFGVKQRAELKNKGINPELLTMTATPIPRTLALTVHGDMDLTLINELPPGRIPIKTALITPGERKKAYTLIAKEVEKGHQVYVVFPLIDESETLSAKAATIEAEKLQESVFPELKIGLVHGKMPNVEKDRVMEEFRAGKYNILVSTTVIEVGVDVPNATVMMIENSERFGLSQLHQLRGRVGRGQAQSYCVLVADTRSRETRERLEVMVQTNNGFVIAESDLKLRGPGEFMGTRQSGVPDLMLADIIRDASVLEIAREAAFDFVKNNELKDYSQLNKKLSNDTLEIEF
ncbi:MAG: ATP-dependent DNA helicase RecG [Candidatus Melainabacteria bacterium GWF2_37_15]|nr:MAG: ATP-dependent DNA helicase RecG [Candidatus Melainabacteria bacterium GWF2_37_15]